MPRQGLIECDQRQFRLGGKSLQIRLRPEVRSAMRMASGPPPMLFQARWLRSKADTPVAAERVVYSPGSPRIEDVRAHHPGVIKQTQKACLRHAAECHRRGSFFLKPVASTGMVDVADRNQGDPYIDVSQVVRQSRNPSGPV